MKNETCTHCGEPIEAEEFESTDPTVQRWLALVAQRASGWLCDECQQSKQAEAISETRHRIAKEQWENSVPAEYRATDPRHPDFPADAYRTCTQWMKGDYEGQPTKLCLGIIGQSGLCKTRMAALLAKRLIWHGNRLAWIYGPRLQWAAQNQFDNSVSQEAKEILSRARYAPWLVLDDIGSLKSTEVVIDALTDLIEHRTSRAMPFIWTSNEQPAEMLAKAPDKARARILSRLVGYSNQVTVEAGFGADEKKFPF